MARRFPKLLGQCGFPEMDELRRYLQDLEADLGPKQYVEGTLGSDLESGDTQAVSINGRIYTINGKSIRSGRKIASGASFGANWNGRDYTIIWANECDEEA